MMDLPVVRSHTRIVSSVLPEMATGRLLSWTVATAVTAPVACEAIADGIAGSQVPYLERLIGAARDDHWADPGSSWSPARSPRRASSSSGRRASFPDALSA